MEIEKKKKRKKSYLDELCTEKQFSLLKHHRIFKKGSKQEIKAIKNMRMLGLLPFSHVTH